LSILLSSELNTSKSIRILSVDSEGELPAARMRIPDKKEDVKSRLKIAVEN
jgi:hypothetical protein